MNKGAAVSGLVLILIGLVAFILSAPDFLSKFLNLVGIGGIVIVVAGLYALVKSRESYSSKN